MRQFFINSRYEFHNTVTGTMYLTIKRNGDASRRFVGMTHTESFNLHEDTEHDDKLEGEEKMRWAAQSLPEGEYITFTNRENGKTERCLWSTSDDKSTLSLKIEETGRPSETDVFKRIGIDQ